MRDHLFHPPEQSRVRILASPRQNRRNAGPLACGSAAVLAHWQAT
jgi:hypothetical protein